MIYEDEKLSELEIISLKEKYGYGKEDKTYYSILARSLKEGDVMFDFMCTINDFIFLRKSEKNKVILRKGEYEKIWDNIDQLSLKNAVDIVKPFLEKSVSITSLEQLRNFMDSFNLTETYLKEKEKNDLTRNISEENLTEVEFVFCKSMSEGVTYMVLNNKVSPIIFSKLKKAGLFYAEGFIYPFPPSWAVVDSEESRLNLKKEGIKIK